MIATACADLSAAEYVTAEDADGINSCVAKMLPTAGDEVTVGTLREACRRQLGQGEGSETALERRLEQEKVTEDSQFVITPHRPNYILIAAHNSAGVNREPFHEFPNYAASLKDTEVKFQLSLKVPLIRDVMGTGGSLFAAYTNRSFWQLYNGRSAPFRETDHEPELFLSYRPDWQLGGFNMSVASVGISHQSNGQAGSLSRSWNRLFAQFVFDRANLFSSGDNLAIAIKPWYRLQEDRDDDDNPDIEHYLGNFELLSVYKRADHIFSLTARNNLKSDSNRGALQLDWSFPLSRKIRGYVQWFNGYGESLIDYDANVNSIGIGIKLTDWL
ncbi:MAG: phospholipase A [Gammaproteobacteria bacterium]|nr:phospholipase A [Gammaproteobacteria bacterium]